MDRKAVIFGIFFSQKLEKYVAMSAKPKKMGSARRKSFFMFVCLFFCFYPIF